MIDDNLKVTKYVVNPTLRHFTSALLVILLLGCSKEEPGGKGGSEDQQKTTPPASSQISQPATDSTPLNTLESLVAPIALYPDPLLAEVLVASTYPLEIVQASRWLETNPDLATLPRKDWDASVARLTSVPSVLKMMNDHLDWTTELGNVFLSKPKEVMDTVQALRKRATDSGFLKDSDQLKVSSETVEENKPAAAEIDSEVKATPAVMTKEVITIQPAKEDQLAVPSYNPQAVYSAPLAPPPGSTASYSTAYPTAAPAYYPAYPAPTTTTTSTSSSDSLLTFGAGALVGGLLTWGIIEWADDDDDYYHVGHYYGNTVCHHGDCWSGGGGGYYNRENNVNISGNEINIDRSKTFDQKDLKKIQNRDQIRGNEWQPDPRHRRGQAYPAAAQKRLGKIQQPALPRNRLPNSQNLRSNLTGYDQGAQGQKRLSTADIENQLRNKPSAERMDSALSGLGSSKQELKREQQRGADSLKRSPQNKNPAIKRSNSAQQVNRETERVQSRNKTTQRARTSQRVEQQKRAQSTRPNAFEGARSPQQSRTFSQRGAESRNRSQVSNQNRQSGNRGGGAGQAPKSRNKGGGLRRQR